MDLETWLRQEKIYHCYDILKEAGVEEPEDLCELTENDLEGMLNWNVLTRRRIVNAITKMKGLTPEPSLLEIVRARSPVERPGRRKANTIDLTYEESKPAAAHTNEEKSEGSPISSGRRRAQTMEDWPYRKPSPGVRSQNAQANATQETVGSISLSDIDQIDVKAVKASAASKQQYNKPWTSPAGQAYNGDDMKTATTRDVNEASSAGKDLDGVFDQVQKEWLENAASDSSLNKNHISPKKSKSLELSESKGKIRVKTEAVLDPFKSNSGELDQRSPKQDSSPVHTSFVSANDVQQSIPNMPNKRAMESGIFDESDFFELRKYHSSGVSGEQKQDLLNKTDTGNMHGNAVDEQSYTNDFVQQKNIETFDERQLAQPAMKSGSYNENLQIAMEYASHERPQPEVESFNFQQDLREIPKLPNVTDLGEVVHYLANLLDCQQPKVSSDVQPTIVDVVNPIMEKCTSELRDVLTGSGGRKKQKRSLAKFRDELTNDRRKLEGYLTAFLEEENPFGDLQALFQEEQEATDILMTHKEYVDNFDGFVKDHDHTKLLLGSITGATMQQMMSMKNPPQPVQDMINAMEKFKRDEIALRAIKDATERKDKVRKKIMTVQRIEEFIENVREQLVFNIELIKACERILEGELEAKKLEEQMRKRPDIGDTKLPPAYVKPYTDTCKKVQRRYSNISQAKLETTYLVLKKYFVLLVRLYKTYAGLEGKLGQGLAGMSSLMWGVCTQALELPMTTDDDEQNYMHDIFDQCTVELESDEKAEFSDEEGAQPWGLNGTWRCENHIWTLQQNYVDMFSGYIQNENYALIEGTVNDDEIMNFSVQWQSVSEKPGLVARCKGAYSDDMLDIRVRYKTNTGESGIWELSKTTKVRRQQKGGSSTLKYDAFILAILWVALYVSPKKEPWDALEYLVLQHIVPKALQKWNVDPKDEGAIQVLEKKKHKKTLGNIFRHYAHDRKDNRKQHGKGKLLTYAKWEELCRDLMRAATRSGINFERPSLRVQQFAFYTSKKLFSTAQVGTLKQLTHTEFLDAVVRLAYKMVQMENLKKGRRKSLRKLELSELNFGPIGDKTSVVIKWLSDVAKHHR